VSEFKAGDKVWVLCDVVNRSQHSAWVEVGSRQGRVWVNASDCEPFEPSNSPKIPDSSSESFRVGDPVRIKDDKDEMLPLVVRSLQRSGSSDTLFALCVSECGKRVRWSALEEMERIDKADAINPSHYKQGGIECIDAIKAALGEGFPDYLRGNVMKYLWRYKEKGGVDDLKKAAWYVDRLIEEAGE
jgi:hypothetical protein